MVDKQEISLIAAFILIIIVSYGVSNLIQSHRVIETQIYYNASATAPDISISTYSVILDENFESTITGSLPWGWEHSGDTQDQANVVYETENSWTKSLYLHEEGGDSQNSVVKISDLDGRNILLDFYYMVNGSTADRQVFQFYNEEGLPCMGMNTLINYSWRYRSPDVNTEGGVMWTNIPGLGMVEKGKQYHIHIYADYELQCVVYGVDGVYSDWLSSQRPWSTITAISFRGNMNYPSDAWYDDVIIIEYTR